MRTRELTSRATQDLEIYKQIANGSKIVYIPTMDKEQFAFWEYICVLLNKNPEFRVTGEHLGAYRFFYGSVLAYSNGLESALIKAMWRVVDTFDYKDYAEWVDPVEIALAFVGAGLGYQTVFFGNERLEGVSQDLRRVGNNQFAEIQKKLCEYSGIYLLSPWHLFTKHELFRVAISSKVKFHSCFNSDTVWCGKCYKCLLIDLLYKIEKKKSPIIMRSREATVLKSCDKYELGVYKNLKLKL